MDQAAKDATADAPALVLSRLESGVLHLTLNRPAQLNALSEEMLAALARALDAADADERVRAIVLGGAGKAFCAGHDLRQMMEREREGYHAWLFAECARVLARIRALRVPVIARVHGIATAGGCQLAAACDLAVAASDARFAASGIRVGLFCSTPAVEIARDLPRKRAFEMLVTGEFVGADEALVHGLVNRVAPPAELDAEISRLTAAIVGKPARAIALGKEFFYRQIEMGIGAAYQLAAQTMACNLTQEDAREGVQAFLEKRAPRWAEPGEGH
jgi:enoyl-CoA hydratase/carnithine racemase